VKLALRMLVKHPLLSLAAVFALAVGIPVGNLENEPGISSVAAASTLPRMEHQSMHRVIAERDFTRRSERKVTPWSS
jgi:hypothetical protein